MEAWKERGPKQKLETWRSQEEQVKPRNYAKKRESRLLTHKQTYHTCQHLELRISGFKHSNDQIQFEALADGVETIFEGPDGAMIMGRDPCRFYEELGPLRVWRGSASAAQRGLHWLPCPLAARAFRG